MKKSEVIGFIKELLDYSPELSKEDLVEDLSFLLKRLKKGGIEPDDEEVEVSQESYVKNILELDKNDLD